MNLNKFGATVASMIALTTGIAFARPDVHLILHGYVLHATQSGPKLDEFSSSSVLRSGDMIEYKVLAKNDSADPALHFITKLDISPATSYRSGSATSSDDVKVEFSIDNGKTFSSNPIRIIHTAQGDVKKSADPATYSTVRWISRELAGRATATYSYEARVK